MRKQREIVDKFFLSAKDRVEVLNDDFNKNLSRIVLQPVTNFAF